VRTVVLCGSLGSTSAMWDPQAAALEERFRLVRVEHPGHGGTPLIDVLDVGDLAEHVLAQVGVERFSFVGLSLGGAVGMDLALGPARGRMYRLVLACTSARFGEPAGWRERAARVRAEGLEWLADVILGRWFTPAFGDVRRYREMFLSTDPEGYARCCDALARWDVRGTLDAIAVPTLAIAGTDDPSAPPGELERIADEIRDARVEVVPSARHLANVERAGAFNALLAEFL
jgi:3-oxoadipate enol-lactonase/4-carboxymuconolactone decarboxylase